jgi:hypothetical protein
MHRFTGAVLCIGLLCVPVAARAQSIPAPAPSPSPPLRGVLQWQAEAHTTFISQSAAGPGLTTTEASGFAQGSPLSPLTPYDTLSSAPNVPGNASESALIVRPTYFGRGAFDYHLTLAVGAAAGSVTNASYWGESLVPALNPHLGAQHLPYAIVFPNHPGQDDGSAFNAGIVNGSIVSKDGNLALKAGWFDLTQTDGFVFTQPAVPNALPAIGMVTAETLGDGTPNLDAWNASSTVLPLHGLDLMSKSGIASYELSSAAMPSLPGTSARMNMVSAVFDHGEGTRWSAQVLHVFTGGDPIATTVLYGADEQLLTTPQGLLPISRIGGQRETIAGLRGAFHIAPHLDGVAEYGHTTYAADLVAQPGTAKPGDYLHAGASRAFGRAALALDVYRNDARYANALLPYGAPENVWSVAWSWPGQWLKSNYQLINDFPVNIDRQGYRVKYTLGGGPLDVRVIYANFGEIEPITLSNALQTGFVDGFFLPQADANATLGRQHQYGGYLGWHPSFGDVTVDYAEDTMRRAAAPGAPQDSVAYDSPELVISFAHHFGSRTLASIGAARYAMRGSFGQGYTNIDYSQRQAMAGIEFAESKRATILASLRRSAFAGIPAAPLDDAPTFTGTIFILEQRYKM